jgi:hypothetical protein
VGKKNAQHLLDTVQKYYKCSCHWKGKQYCGLTIKWDYEGQKVHLSMSGYVKKALTPPGKATGPTLPPRQTKLWGKKYSQEDDDSPALNKARKKIIQEVCGVFFFYLRGRSMGDYSLPSALLHPNRQTRQRIQWGFASNF